MAMRPGQAKGPSLFGSSIFTSATLINPTITGATYTAGTTAKAPLNLAPGVAPTSPIDGDIWYDGTNIKIRVGATTKTFTII